MTVRTRFAPSPTGSMHIGSLRTALYCYAMARKNSGKFILRIEDTDQERYVEESLHEIYDVLDAYGLTPDESDVHGGDFGPYTQSRRLEMYQKYAKELVEKGAAYYCFLTDEEAAEIRSSLQGEHKPFRSPYRDLDKDEAERRSRLQSGPPVIRQLIPAGRTIEFNDNVQGHMKFSTDDVDDGVLLKSDGFPTYHLAMLVDDHLMEITHVFRAFEWIPSIPKHVLLYEAMGWDMPQMYHLSTILDPEGGKLSKRKGATAAKEFLAEGYLPEAVLNFLMFLGWAAPIKYEHGESEREIFTLDEFIELFDPKDLNKSNPVFNDQKLEWFNQQWLAKLSPEELMGKFVTWLTVYSDGLPEEGIEKLKNDATLSAKLELVQTRIKLLKEVPELLAFFYDAPRDIDWGVRQIKGLGSELMKKLLEEIHSLISSLPDATSSWQHEAWELGMRAIADRHGIKHGDAFMVLRLAVCGGPVSPPLFESLQILGKEEILERLKA